MNMSIFCARAHNLQARSEGSEIVSKDELRTLIEFSPNMRARSIISFLKDSGLRSGDAFNLKVGDVLEAINNPSIEFFALPKIKVQKTFNKSGLVAESIIGRDALKYLRLWMQERRNLGISANKDDYLFCSLQTQDAIEVNGRSISGTTRGAKIESSTFSQAFYRIVQNSGLTDKKISVHSLRKYFLTRLESSGMPLNWIARLQGKSGVGSTGVYSKPKSELLEKYKESYYELSLTDESQAGEIEELKKSQERMIATILTLKTRLIEIELGLSKDDKILSA